jgi:hypothetical protein
VSSINLTGDPDFVCAPPHNATDHLPRTLEQVELRQLKRGPAEGIEMPDSRQRQKHLRVFEKAGLARRKCLAPGQTAGSATTSISQRLHRGHQFLAEFPPSVPE